MAKHCIVCNKKIGIMGKGAECADGFICLDCLRGMGIESPYLYADRFKMMSVCQVRDLANDARATHDIVKNFKPTYSVGDRAKFDDESRIMIYTPILNLLGKYRDESFMSLPYDSIVDFELIEDGGTVAKGGVGRAVAGGLLFGGVGAIVGGTTGKKKTTCRSLYIDITTSDPEVPTIRIAFITGEVKTDSPQYGAGKNAAQKIMSKLKQITDDKSPEPAESASMDAADEIRKFKALLDDGIITQEEFDKKKQELL